MRLVRAFLFLALIATLAGTAQAVVISPIDSLHWNNANGIPLFQLQRRLITVQGTVTSPDSIFSPTNTDIYIQDATGGCDVFIGAGIGLHHFGMGDSVQVSGYVKHFNGLSEIDSSSALVTVTSLGTATVPPDPYVMTISTMNAGWVPIDYHEPWEGRLIRINGVHVTSGTWPVSKPAANTTLTIADATGSGTLFISRYCGANGTPDPGSKFDVIGIVKQFDSTSPYTSGYEICPRFASDIISECPGPQYTTTPVCTMVDSLTATIQWSTDTLSTTFVRYGQTTAYTDSVNDPTMTLDHSITLTGLSPRTLYHFQALSVGAFGSCPTKDRAFVTWPSPGTDGTITTYFDYSVDTTVARLGVPKAQGNVTIRNPMISLINSAKSTIDCALYSFSISDVTNALIAAVQRGVRVRLIIDAGNSNSEASRLTLNGGAYISSTYGGNHGAATGYGIMHSKYLVVDASTGNKDDAYVWTGSWNCSSTGQYDYNNVLVVHDYGMSQIYTLDFEQMWGSSTYTPNSATSKMGNQKRDLGAHLLRIGDRPVEVYMSPSDQVQTRFIQTVQQSTASQQFCILDFTADTTSHYMKTHRDSIPNFLVRGVFDMSSNSGGNEATSEYDKLAGYNTVADYWIPAADVLRDPVTGSHLLHHKYAIFDEGLTSATVWTGSFNWSNAANTVNDENSVVIHDPTLANIYFQEFWARYKESGGTGVIGVGGVNSDRLSLAQSLPNPARGGALIRFTIPTYATKAVQLKVYDPAGRLVRTLQNGPMSAGAHSLRWDGRTQSGAPAAGGVYFYRLVSGQQSLTRKLVLVH